MDTRLGQLRAELTLPADESISPELIARINANVRPPSPVGDQDVHIRSMYIVSDQINSYGGRFPSEEHTQLAALLVDSPVLIGHQKDSLPIGRTFHADLATRDSRNWVKSYFYWLKSAEGAESLRENIDGGIYKECSIGFTFTTPQCSICEQDIRQCSHIPLERYIIDDQERLCHFNYRGIERVLETSLVYRGANPDTSISRDLQITKTPVLDNDTPELSANLAELTREGRYLVVPRYEGVDLTLKLVNGKPIAWRKDGRAINMKTFGNLDTAGIASPTTTWHGRLVGFRGKERCSLPHLEQYLRNETGPVSRLTLFMYPSTDNTPTPRSNANAYHRVQPIRHRAVMAAELQAAASELATKSGTEILSLAANGDIANVYRYQTIDATDKSNPPDAGLTVSLCNNSRHGVALLQCATPRGNARFVLYQFEPRRFAQGRRFVADRLTEPLGDSLKIGRPCLTMEIAECSEQDGGWLLQTTQPDGAMIAIRPVRLDSKRRFLVYRVTGN